MPTSEPRASAATPEQILSAATRLFSARGVGGTSLKDVADAVGIRKQSLLYHFPSKEELRQAVLEHLLARWNDVLPRLLMAATSGEDQFDAVLAETVEFFAADPDRARLLLRELLDRPDHVRALLPTHVRPWVEAVSRAIRKGIERGTTAPRVDPEAYVVALINLVLSTIATADCLTALADRRRLLAELARIAKASLLAPTAREDL
ncbi:MAG TPA: TetR family transcriptional regulator [Kofleriaceae bacterium]|nr:TetR family transcriptional regulator [Kofleriaceae bacterium]